MTARSASGSRACSRRPTRPPTRRSAASGRRSPADARPMSRAPDSTREDDAGKSARPASVHWLVRVAERAGLAGREHLDLPANTPAREAWPVITRAFSINDAKLAGMVAEYFRLEV